MYWYVYIYINIESISILVFVSISNFYLYLYLYLWIYVYIYIYTLYYMIYLSHHTHMFCPLMFMFCVEWPSQYKVQRQGCAALWSPPVHGWSQGIPTWKCLRSTYSWVFRRFFFPRIFPFGCFFLLPLPSLWSFPISSKVKAQSIFSLFQA